MTDPVPPGSEATTTTPAAPSSTAAQVEPPGFAIGVDGHFAIGESLIQANIGLRAELAIAPHHALVVRAGIGSVQWVESESDDPEYRELFARVGYRVSAKHIYAGVELGRSVFKAYYPAMDGMPARDGNSFGGTTYTALVGWKLGPVDLGFDYTVPMKSFGIYLGAGYRSR